MCSLASEYESEWCCVLQICFLMHASAECAEASLLSAINKITEAARAAARLVFDDPSRTGDGSKCPVMQLVNHTHTARNPRLFCIRGCVGNCVEDQRGPSVRPSFLIPSLDRTGRFARQAQPAASRAPPPRLLELRAAIWRRPGQGAADTEQAQRSQALPVPCSPGDKCYSSALQTEIDLFLLTPATHFQAAKRLPSAEKMRLILFLLPNSPREFFCQEAPGAKQWELVRCCRPSAGWPRTELAAGRHKAAIVPVPPRPRSCRSSVLRPARWQAFWAEQGRRRMFAINKNNPPRSGNVPVCGWLRGFFDSCGSCGLKAPGGRTDTHLALPPAPAFRKCCFTPRYECC